MSFECRGPACQNPPWMGTTLKLAGAYNLLFGLWVAGWPDAWFSLSGMEEPRYPFLWQCIGMIVGVYGIGYLVASLDPLRHWPIVLVGFLGKVFGPLGFVVEAYQGNLPWRAGWMIFLNDLIWWVPFGMILWAAACRLIGRPVRGEAMSLREALGAYKLEDGETLERASGRQELAIVFLRHFGCTFTRELLRNLEDMKKSAEAQGAKLVLVHMLQEGEENRYLKPGEVATLADPRCELYRAFGLGKGGFRELFGPRVWLRGFVAIFKGCGVGHLAGDGLQMPGAFRLKNGQIIASKKAKNAADLPRIQALYEPDS